jgi:hypothetical protein
MGLRDYFVGRRLVLRSVLPRAEVKRRINCASGSAFWPFNSGVVGGCALDRVRLQIRNTPFDYNAKPLLAGRLHDALGGTELYVRYGASAWTRVFFVYWYSFLTLFTVAAVVAVPSDDAPLLPGLLVIPLLLFAAPVLMHMLFVRNSEEELDEILGFLEREAGAKLVER